MGSTYPHDRQIVRGLMAWTATVVQTRQGADDLDRQIFLGNGHADEVISATRAA
jgi:hypothetical protein